MDSEWAVHPARPFLDLRELRQKRGPQEWQTAAARYYEEHLSRLVTLDVGGYPILVPQALAGAINKYEEARRGA